MFIMMIGLGGGLTALASWVAGPGNAGHVRVVYGYVSAVNATGTLVSIAERPGAFGQFSVDVSKAIWRDPAQGAFWNYSPAPDGSPTCLGPSTFGQHVRIGVQEPTTEGVGQFSAVWLECLSGPTGVI